MITMDKYLIDKILEVVELPYLKSLITMGIDDKDIIQNIFNTLYNDEVIINYGNNFIYIYNTKQKKVYTEGSNGFWEKTLYDDNGNEIYLENSYGYWEKKEYSHNNWEVYYQNSQDYWSKKEYDEKGNRIYYEDSNGYRSKKNIKTFF